MGGSVEIIIIRPGARIACATTWTHGVRVFPPTFGEASTRRYKARRAQFVVGRRLQQVD